MHEAAVCCMSYVAPTLAVCIHWPDMILQPTCTLSLPALGVNASRTGAHLQRDQVLEQCIN